MSSQNKLDKGKDQREMITPAHLPLCMKVRLENRGQAGLSQSVARLCLPDYQDVGARSRQRQPDIDIKEI